MPYRGKPVTSETSRGKMRSLWATWNINLFEPPPPPHLRSRAVRRRQFPLRVLLQQLRRSSPSPNLPSHPSPWIRESRCLSQPPPSPASIASPRSPLAPAAPDSRLLFPARFSSWGIASYFLCSRRHQHILRPTRIAGESAPPSQVMRGQSLESAPALGESLKIRSFRWCYRWEPEQGFSRPPGFGWASFSCRSALRGASHHVFDLGPRE